MGDELTLWITFPLFSLIACMSVHWVLLRALPKHFKGNCRQRNTALMSLSLALIFTALALTIFSHSDQKETLIITIYTFLVSSSLCYFYFHIYNISVCSVRLRLLLTWYDAIKNHGAAKCSDVVDYDQRIMVENRLTRLEKMGVIYQKENKYFTRPGLMVSAMHFFKSSLWRHIF